MCGIAGIIKFNGSSISTNEIDELTDSLAHRGPDGRGTWFNQNKNIALGHRRLSILDLSIAGQQPMVSHNEKFVIALNGEIYNFIEIKQTLLDKGYIFKSETDTEVILTAYQEWGLTMLDRFNGMWAAAIYDVHRDKLILTRDRFGVKPLYYYWDGNELAFASEVQALHKYLGKQASINEETIHDILDFNQAYHGTERTYLNEVKSLGAGTNLILEKSIISIERWYQLKLQSVPKSFKAQAEKLKDLLTDACKIRLRSDVPVGTCLSGGVDSGAISSLISTFNANDDARFSNFSHRSFCAGFPGVSFDETKDAKRLAKQLDINLDVEIVNAPDALFLEEAMNKTDGPMPAFAFFPIWQLYRYIKKQNITVTLDGQGADEMLGGYFMAYDAMKGALDLCNLSWFFDVKRTYSCLHERAYSWVKNDIKHLKKIIYINFKQALKLPLKKLLSVFNLYNFKNNKFESIASKYFNNNLDKALSKQFFVTPLPFLLHQYDRASMANGIECRMPFMDYRVVEYIFSLPPKSKVGNGYTKRVLREALDGVLPDETRLNKTKTGFNAPTNEWFKTDLNEWFIKQIKSKSFLENPYFDGKAISNEFLNVLNTEKAEDYKWKFWAYTHVNYWLDNL